MVHFSETLKHISCYIWEVFSDARKSQAALQDYFVNTQKFSLYIYMKQLYQKS